MRPHAPSTCLALLLAPVLVSCAQMRTGDPGPADISFPGDSPLSDFATAAGVHAAFLPPDTLIFTNAALRLRFERDSRRLEAWDTVVWLNSPAACSTGIWSISDEDLSHIVIPLAGPTGAPPSTACVVLDPGHGGADGGATSAGELLVEKQLVLDIARRADSNLTARGVQVFMTRRDDRFVPLEQRDTTVASCPADAFVSIHLNAAANADAAGPETFVLPSAGCPPTAQNGCASTHVHPGNGHDRWNTLLGYCIHSRLPGRSPAQDRGLRRARYQVLRQAACPAALVECGFLSNLEDARRLDDPDVRESIAAALADGILDFLGRRAAETPDRCESMVPDPTARKSPLPE